MVAVQGFLDAEGSCEADYSGAFCLRLVLEDCFKLWRLDFIGDSVYEGELGDIIHGVMTYPITTIVSFSGILV